MIHNTTTYRLTLTTTICSLAWQLIGCSTQTTTLDPAPIDLVRKAADYVLTDFPEPPQFNWGEGVLMAGMMRAGAVTGNGRYTAFVKRWADHWHHKDIGPVLKKKGYCGHWGPAYPVAMLYRVTGDSIYLSMADRVAQFMETQATRTLDGGLGHWRENYQLWVDTLFMSCPVYAELGYVMDKPEYIAQAAFQLNVSANHLQDDKTGLFYHMYDETKDKHTDEFWGRGNGWTAMAYISVLQYLKPDHAQYNRVAKDFKRLADGLIPMQDKDTGLFHTVLNRPDSYLETSCTAMILYSLIEARKLGFVTIDDSDFIQRSWTGLVSKVDADGKIFDVSAGTGPTDYDTYLKVKQGTETWGTGAFLLAASSLMEHHVILGNKANTTTE